ncbi:uncharacterized protein LOC134657623 [Cydia amplana]|uniref:uncharacterized protein LOC134657623 n=1 Tax=Cydia amplana TaxID=1869771 RepID=UPI002FE5DC1F
MVANKLDSNTSLKWEEFKSNSFSNDDMPSLADFNRFLKGRADVLESVQRNKSDKPITNNNNKREPIASPHNKREKSSTKCFAVSATPAASASASPPACVFCSGEHRIYDCSSFLSLPVEDRISGASRLRLCLNCLRKGHTSHRCRVAPCHTCHFIIGRALTSLPSPHLADINPNRLDRFQRLEALRQQFWRRWQLEYVCELQQRTKWRVPGRDLQLGDLVLIKEENTPPLHWRLGRIAKLFPGADGISRVAEVATVTGTYKRGVKYLCPLLDDTHEALKADASKGPQDVAAPTNEGEAGTVRQ